MNRFENDIYNLKVLIGNTKSRLRTCTDAQECMKLQNNIDVMSSVLEDKIKATEKRWRW